MKRAHILPGLLFSLACNDGATVINPPDAGPDVVTVDVAPPKDVQQVDVTADVVVNDGPLDCGDAGLVQCGNVCADLKTSSPNCGFCGHDCGTGACTEGLCPVETLASGLEYPIGIAVDGTSFYVTDSGDPTTLTGGDVLKCPVAGCPAKTAPMTANLNNPQDIAVDATNVYWLNRDNLNSATGSVMMCPIAGCGASDANRVTLAKAIEFPGSLALDATNVYFSDFGPKPTHTAGKLLSCKIAGCAQKPTTIITPVSRAGEATVNATTAFIIGAGGTNVMKQTLGTSGVGTVIESDMAASYAFLISYSGNLIWSDSAAGTVRECPEATCNMNSQAVVQNLVNAGPIARDAKGLYMMDLGMGLNSAKLLFCTDAQSCMNPTVLADKLDAPANIALDAGFVYWTNPGETDNTGTVNRVAR